MAHRSRAFIVLLYLLPAGLMGQPSGRSWEGKFEFGYLIPTISQDYLDANNLKSENERNHLTGFTLQPLNSYRMGLLMDMVSEGKWVFRSGLTLLRRRNTLETDTSSLATWHPGSETIRYTYTTSSLGVPFFLGYRMGALEMQAGIRWMPWLISRKTVTINLSGQETENQDKPYVRLTSLHPEIKVHLTLGYLGDTPLLWLFAGMDAEDFSRSYYRFQVGAGTTFLRWNRP